jgi:dTDP-4-amino-4,6-dideoxygalactose transaminase
MVPYLDLKAEYASLREEIQTAIAGVLESSQFVLGKYVEDFERDFAAYCGVQHAIAVSTGTSALHLALLAAGVGAGDEVITVPFTFIATVASIAYCNATPVLVDIDPVMFNMDVDRIEEKITARTKAILPVHLYGQPAEMDAINEIAKRHGLRVIEDAAQAHGAEYRSRRTGSLGDLGCFSFYPTKNLGAYGEGGMVTTDDGDLARQVRMLRDWGQDRKYHHVVRGFNYRMQGLQGAILGVKLRHLETWTDARRQIAAAYDDALAGSNVRRPCAPPHVRHVYHTYTIRSPRRDELQARLAERGIQTAVHYGIPAHLQGAYADLGYEEGSFPESERAAKEALSLPIYPMMKMNAVTEVAEAVKQFA